MNFRETVYFVAIVSTLWIPCGVVFFLSGNLKATEKKFAIMKDYRNATEFDTMRSGGS